MQKVEGSSPFIRFKKPPENGGFLLAAAETEGACCDRYCNRRHPYGASQLAAWRGRRIPSSRATCGSSSESWRRAG